MKKVNKSDLCPLCGGERKPVTKTSRAALHASAAIVYKAPKTVASSFGSESSDDQTANDFAAALMKAQSPQPDGK